MLPESKFNMKDVVGARIEDLRAYSTSEESQAVSEAIIYKHGAYILDTRTAELDSQKGKLKGGLIAEPFIPTHDPFSAPKKTVQKTGPANCAGIIIAENEHIGEWYYVLADIVHDDGRFLSTLRHEVPERLLEKREMINLRTQERKLLKYLEDKGSAKRLDLVVISSALLEIAANDVGYVIQFLETSGFIQKSTSTPAIPHPANYDEIFSSYEPQIYQLTDKGKNILHYNLEISKEKDPAKNSVS